MAEQVDSKERYPQIPEEYLTRTLITGYSGAWKVVASSTGQRDAWKNNVEQQYENAPSEVIAECTRRLQTYSEDTSSENISSETADRLQQLGYL